MVRLRRLAHRVFIVLLSVVLATAVGALGEMPFWEAPSWWWLDENAWATLAFYALVVAVGLAAGWLLARSFSGIAQYDRFDEVPVKRCDVLVLPLSVYRGSEELPAVPGGVVSTDDLKRLANGFAGTNLEPGWGLFLEMLARDLTPHLMLFRGLDAGSPRPAPGTNPTLLPYFEAIATHGVHDGIRTWHPGVSVIDADKLDLQDCYSKVRREMERLSTKRRAAFVMDITGGTSSMSVAVALLGITEDQILAYKKQGRPYQFFDARIRLVSPFTAMSGS